MEADCEDVVDTAIGNLSAMLAESGGEVTRGALPTVKGDKPQLVQLFQNLIGNGIKFHGEDRPRVHVSAERKGEEWEFAVRDNGIGIAAEFYQRIFIIFRRLEPAEEYAGTGIGLALCKKIVERHGGGIWVESEAGEGSTFRFTLPA